MYMHWYSEDIYVISYMYLYTMQPDWAVALLIASAHPP